jgi:acyl carrier protein
MTKSEFLREIETIVEADPSSLTMDDQLDSIDKWDSMAVISFISMIDMKLSIVLDDSALASCKTVGDLVRLCEGKLV